MRVATCTATLELQTEKKNGHDDGINSIAYSPDGSQIASVGGGGFQKPGTLKVWELRPFVESEWEQFDKTLGAGTSMERVEQWWRNKMTATGDEQEEKPSGPGE